MPAVNCPYCGQDNDVEPLADGASVRCFNCGNAFVPRGYVQTAEEYQPPQIVVVSHSSAPRLQPRLKAGGWFSRAFATTTGVLVAILAFNLVVAIICAFFFVLALTYAKSVNNQPPAKVSRSR